MAFIREYAANSGDPFKLRLPRAIRKFQPGKALARVGARLVPVAGLIPGVGALLSPFLQRVTAAAQRVGISPDEVLDFARSYGLDVGDPGAPKPANKRRGAGAGTKAKAAKKENARVKREITSGPRPTLAGMPSAGGKAAKLLDLFSQAAGGASTIAGLIPKGSKAGAFGGRHRRLNPANVKALNRSLRRVEGFEKLAHRVMGHKLFRRVRGSARQVMRAGHKPGCRCVACRRAA
jgi:hypothetical protein